MRDINSIILHCSATKEGKDYTTKDIDSWHKQRGFKEIGYHFVVYRDGSIHRGRAIDKEGAHCLSHNKNSIGICYIGGLDKNGNAKDTRTDEQKDSLLALVCYLTDKYRIPDMHVRAHYEFQNKLCPCFDIKEFQRDLFEYRAKCPSCCKKITIE